MNKRKPIAFYTDDKGRRRPITKGVNRKVIKPSFENPELRYKTIYVEKETPKWIEGLINKLDEVDEQTWFGEIDGKWYIVEWSPREGEPVEEGWWTIVELTELGLLDAKGRIKDLMLYTLFDYAAKHYLLSKGFYPV